ncbi:MAG: hypothetical protein IKL72_05990 [Firmicutes bacterium]|nr:hypothetical protein [Bacillota bacterium]
MIYSDVVFGSVEPDKVSIDIDELERRLGGGCDIDSEQISRLRNLFDEKVSYRFAYARMEISFPEKGICDFGCGCIESGDLYKNLRDCKAVYMMGVTLGIGIDRLLSMLRIRSAAEHYIIDGMASAAVESFCNMLDKELRAKEGFKCRPRYSPGYGDCTIYNQKLLTDRIDAARTLGMTLNESYFMTPSKSITAIMGIKNE